VKSEKDADSLMTGLREQMRYYRKLKTTGAHESKWTLGMLSTYLNGERWTDEIPSHYELQQKQTKKKCDCGNKADIQNLCWTCYCKKTGMTDWREKKIWEYFIQNNLGQQPDETKELWLTRLRKTYRENVRKL
jgi:hypothetical protein